MFCAYAQDAVIQLVGRTNMNYREEVLRVCNPAVLADPVKLLSNAGMGLAGESGEVIDLIKKHLHQDQPLNKEKLINELGDVLWYAELLSYALGVTTDEAKAINNEKLRKRYPDGFSVKDSIERRDIIKDVLKDAP